MTRIFSSGIRAAAVVCALLAAAVPLAAQIAEAELQGVVVDESGGVLPGVTLTLTHVETGTSRSVVTSDNGRYVARGLRVGDYDVVAELGGFATVRRAGITLLLGQSATLDIAMKLAVVEETLTVTGEAPLIDIGKSGIGSNLDVRQMQGLPLNGRDWMSLTLVAPGVRGGGGEQGPGVGIIPSFGGMNNYRTKVNVDGVQTNESTNFNSVDINFSQDSVREVQVLSNRFSAEFSRASGGIINAVTKSGTNKFSGSFYGFFRNDAFNAKHWFTGRVEPFEDNQIGGTIGGPLKKDRLHFFFSWESERRPQTQTPRNGIPLLEQSYPNDFTQDAGMLRFDYQLTPTHRLTARAA
ncbi:MAG: TonB-dependent receptor, partial [Acidobacteria bacterium]|nr:TonB-dependent receptor [Acidobacteriota bacterium]